MLMQTTKQKKKLINLFLAKTDANFKLDDVEKGNTCLTLSEKPKH